MVSCPAASAVALKVTATTVKLDHIPADQWEWAGTLGLGVCSVLYMSQSLMQRSFFFSPLLNHCK